MKILGENQNEQVVFNIEKDCSGTVQSMESDPNVIEEVPMVSIDSSSITVEANSVDENNYMCGFCYQLYDSVQDVETHMQQEHPTEMETHPL